MEKIAIVVRGGMIEKVYCTPALHQTDVEIIDLDTTIPDEEQAALNRLQEVQQFLYELY